MDADHVNLYKKIFFLTKNNQIKQLQADITQAENEPLPDDEDDEFK